MATRVELPQGDVLKAINKELASIRRQLNATDTNPLIKEILQKEVQRFSHAAMTLTEIK